MKHLIYAILFFSFIAVFSGCSEEKIDGSDTVFGTVTGKVVSSDTFEPLANVKIFSSPTSSTVFSDENGNFTISNIKVGEYSLQAQKDDYLTKFESVTVNEGLASEVVFEMSKNTGPNTAPTIPTAVSPLDNALNQSITTKLSWEATDANNDVLKFTVTVRNSANNDITIFSDLTEKELELTNLSYGVKYFWQVAVTDDKSTAVLSSVFTFSTMSFPNTRYLMVKKIGDNNVIYAGDDTQKTFQITSTEKNSWRPRKNNLSNKIAFIQSVGAQNHIFMMNADGTSKTQITNAVPIAGFNSNYIGFSWNQSGDKLIYPNFDKLYEINSNGSGLRKVFQTPNGKFISECDWSADGTKIVLKVNDINGYNVEIYIINTTGVITNQVISGQSGAFGGLNFSVTGQKLVYTRDVSGYENPMYRQLDARIYEYNFATLTSYQIITEKPSGTNDLDVRYSPSEAELIFVNTSNDGLSIQNVVKTTIGKTDSRTILFSGNDMPDWE
ncbi:carboxypeptidase regulatory-like domain-containing protein [Flavobacterium agrisoli]|uniref:Carboxypeptidase regulatory-like domain-containing protein n=1 Tax=Flavobacterium agrisoli TaxID=2793066 RepID=A0A934PJB2_9FLAO|nr:carboxypeptidase regulatory-like domain-containing protein [Flavobacterium agrisoli]MBK0369176.1 carboxypeptidase regulatory-like domain-containing protein [Flavobacterium agrisoli]